MPPTEKALPAELRVLGGRRPPTRAAHAKTLRGLDLVVLQTVRLSDEDDALATKVREQARALAKVRHAHVASVREAIEEEDAITFVTEWVDGVTYGDLVRVAAEKDHDIPLGVHLRVILDALVGLGAIHGARDRLGKPLGRFHGDLALENLIVGVDGVSKLVSWCAGGSGGDSAPDHVRFMAPEVLLGDDTADLRVDLYAAGVLLYEALSGRRIFHDTGAGAILAKHLAGKVEPASAPDSAPWAAPLLPLIQRAISTDPAQRQATAAEVAAELRRIAGTNLAAVTTVAALVKELAGDAIVARRAQLAPPGSPPLVLAAARKTEPSAKIEAPKIDPSAKIEARKPETSAKIEAPKPETSAKIEARKPEASAKVEAKAPLRLAPPKAKPFGATAMNIAPPIAPVVAAAPPPNIVEPTPPPAPAAQPAAPAASTASAPAEDESFRLDLLESEPPPPPPPEAPSALGVFGVVPELEAEHALAPPPVPAFPPAPAPTPMPMAMEDAPLDVAGLPGGANDAAAAQRRRRMRGALIAVLGLAAVILLYAGVRAVSHRSADDEPKKEAAATTNATTTQAPAATTAAAPAETTTAAATATVAATTTAAATTTGAATEAPATAPTVATTSTAAAAGTSTGGTYVAPTGTGAAPTTTTKVTPKPKPTYDPLGI